MVSTALYVAPLLQYLSNFRDDCKQVSLGLLTTNLYALAEANQLLFSTTFFQRQSISDPLTLHTMEISLLISPHACKQSAWSHLKFRIFAWLIFSNRLLPGDFKAQRWITVFLCCFGGGFVSPCSVFLMFVCLLVLKIFPYSNTPCGWTEAERWTVGVEINLDSTLLSSPSLYGIQMCWKSNEQLR